MHSVVAFRYTAIQSWHIFTVNTPISEFFQNTAWLSFSGFELTYTCTQHTQVARTQMQIMYTCNELSLLQGGILHSLSCHVTSWNIFRYACVHACLCVSFQVKGDYSWMHLIADHTTVCETPTLRNSSIPEPQGFGSRWQLNPPPSLSLSPSPSVLFCL